MTVQQVYIFSISTENISAAMATDGAKVQYMTPGYGPDDEDNRDRAELGEEMLKLAGDDVDDPFVLLAGNIMAMVTDPFEFPSFEEAADAAQELFDRNAVADEFAV